MNTKAKGTRNEHRSMVLLEDVGYRCTRSAASLGEWDIVGVGKHDVVLVQVKTNKWPSRAELSRLQDFEVPSGVGKIVHRWRDRQRKPDVMILFKGPIHAVTCQNCNGEGRIAPGLKCLTCDGRGWVDAYKNGPCKTSR